VLTNDSFAVLPHAITEGQRIIAGMQDVLKLFLTRTFFLALLIIAVVTVGTFPFSPRQPRSGYVWYGGPGAGTCLSVSWGLIPCADARSCRV